MSKINEIVKADLESVVSDSQEFWRELQDQNLFVTGGTGFFGNWLLRSFAHANRKLHLNAHVWILSRDPDGFRRRSPELGADPCVHFYQGDVVSFEFPKERKFSHIIHAATLANTQVAAQEPLQTLDTIVDGTRRVLEFAKLSGTKKMLFTSSGAVYGKQPADLFSLSEEYLGAPDPLVTKSSYGEGKRMAEHLCSLYQKECGIEVKVARCFTFVGPYLPLGLNFAIGNFIRDALAGKPIIIQGDGSTIRSYLYTSDLMTWLFNIFGKGTPGHAYNVGSEIPYSILDIANQVGHFLKVEVKVVGTPEKWVDRYVPSTLRARNALGLSQKVDLLEAIERTIKWHRS